MKEGKPSSRKRKPIAQLYHFLSIDSFPKMNGINYKLAISYFKGVLPWQNLETDWAICLRFHPFNDFDFEMNEMHEHVKWKRYWRPLGVWVRMLSDTIRSIVSLLAILFLFIFIFAVLGLQLFGGRFKPDRRTNFDTLWEAFLAVFQVTIACHPSIHPSFLPSVLLLPSLYSCVCLCWVVLMLHGLL